MGALAPLLTGFVRKVKARLLRQAVRRGFVRAGLPDAGVGKAASMVFKRVGDGRPYPDHGLTTRDWAAIRPTRVRLSDLAGRPVVVYFYPKDDTPGCTKEACSLRDRFGALCRGLRARIDRVREWAATRKTS